MKILSIGPDNTVFDPNSRVAQRQIEYGKLFDEFHIIVLTTKKDLHDIKLSPNVFLYPTCSDSPFSYISDAVTIGHKITQQTKIDIITTQDPFLSGLAGYRLKKKFKIPLHIQIHTDIFSPFFKKAFLRNRIYVIMARFIVRHADRVRVVSNNIKKNLISRWNIPESKIDVLPIFFDIAPFEQKDGFLAMYDRYSSYHPKLLVVSRLTKEKNVALAIHLLADLLEYYQSPRLIIVGDGPERNNLENLSRQLKVDHFIEFIGHQSRLIDYYHIASALIVPSLYEGFGMVITEAFASACPVIMSDVGSVGDLFFDHENVLVFPINNRVKLLLAVRELLQSTVLRTKLIEGGKKTILGLPKKDEYLQLFKEGITKTRD